MAYKTWAALRSGPRSLTQGTPKERFSCLAWGLYTRRIADAGNPCGAWLEAWGSIHTPKLSLTSRPFTSGAERLGICCRFHHTRSRGMWWASEVIQSGGPEGPSSSLAQLGAAITPADGLPCHATHKRSSSHLHFDPKPDPHSGH